jgi:beta-lactamase regulating signal transducer with metallopeptidase domain
MTTQAIEDQTKALRTPYTQNAVEKTLSWIWIFVVWGLFFWLIYCVLFD